MFLDAPSDGTTLETDICVIGGGPAGLTVASEFLGTHTRVLVLEAGGLTYDPALQDLADGKASGPVIKTYAKYLKDSRYFQLEGATPWWGGFCMPLDRIDFEKRPWVDLSGWPFSRETLDPYFVRASKTLNIQPFGESPGLPANAGTRLIAHRYHFPKDVRVFGEEFQKHLKASPNVHVALRSVVTDFTSKAGRIERARVVTPSGEHYWVQARSFVLAGGGIENARMLLLQTQEHPGTLGGNPDALGAFFMEHFHVFVGSVTMASADGWQLFAERFDPTLGHPQMLVLGLNDATQTEHRLLNASVQFETAWRSSASLKAGGPLKADLFLRAEQAPNPESRVLLSDARDQTGRRRAELRWIPTAQDWDSIARTTQLICADLEQSFGAKTESRISAENPWPGRPGGPTPNGAHSWGCHHTGTTRMATRAEQGVVDTDCRVFGTDNLFVAGSSVFPTTGWANPTFTLVALAIRIADHLKQQV